MFTFHPGHQHRWEAKIINNAWRIGMEGNLDTVHDSSITVHSFEEDLTASGNIARWLVTQLNGETSVISAELHREVSRAIAKGCNLDPDADSPKAKEAGHLIPEWMFFGVAASNAIRATGASDRKPVAWRWREAVSLESVEEKPWQLSDTMPVGDNIEFQPLYGPEGSEKTKALEQARAVIAKSIGDHGGILGVIERAIQS